MQPSIRLSFPPGSEGIGQADPEKGSFTETAFRPNTAAVSLNQLLDNG